MTPERARIRGGRVDLSPTLVGERIVRFRDPAHACGPLPPFPAYVAPLSERGRAPLAEVGARPVFWDVGGRRRVEISLEPGSSVYGLGEICGPLEHRGRDVTQWATDCFGYSRRSRSLYQAHPWALVVRRDGSAFGVMVETTWKCRVRVGCEIVFECDGPSPAVVVVERDGPAEVVKALAGLTGYMPMPPKWALGYQQCRWSYEPESTVRELAAEFRTRKIPCDVIWLDIDYMDGFRCFTHDEAKFPQPAKLNADLRAQGFRTVYMIDPGIKAEPGYGVYDAGRAGDHFVKDARGAEYQGSVWPGLCAFPDFMRKETREWWGSLYADFLKLGMDGVWNDMNEPAVFEGPGKTMPESNQHEADDELGGPGSHAKYHNLYGMQMVRATREGIERARPGVRPFVLTRSNFLGGQRYAATWTGDNTSDWAHLRWSIPMALNLGLSGQPFAGPDIGGFAGNADAELFAKWMGIGALLPFARAHSIKDSVPHEPWAFGEECERACRLALERRYRLMPYLYTAFHEAHTTGLPVVRPVFFADPGDPSLRGVDHAFLLGGDVLVVANVEPGDREIEPVLKGWREFEIAGDGVEKREEAEGAAGHGGRLGQPTYRGRAHRWLPRLFVRPGAIVPVGPSVQHSNESVNDELTFVVHFDPNKPDKDVYHRAHGTLYEDDGESLGCQRGDWCVREIFAAVRMSQDGTRMRKGQMRFEQSGGHRPPTRLRSTRVHWLFPDGSDELGFWAEIEMKRVWLGSHQEPSG